MERTKCFIFKGTASNFENALSKIDSLNIEQRLGIFSYDKHQLTLFRHQCKNIKLRHIYYRLISRDFYTKERMLRFGMSRDSDCARCGEVESYRHLFWECPESGRVWRAYKPCILSLN